MRLKRLVVHYALKISFTKFFSASGTAVFLSLNRVLRSNRIILLSNARKLGTQESQRLKLKAKLYLAAQLGNKASDAEFTASIDLLNFHWTSLEFPDRADTARRKRLVASRHLRYGPRTPGSVEVRCSLF